MTRRLFHLLLIMVVLCAPHVALADTGCDFDCAGRGTQTEHCIENLSNDGNLASCRDLEHWMLCCDGMTGWCWPCGWSTCDGKLCMIA